MKTENSDTPLRQAARRDARKPWRTPRMRRLSAGDAATNVSSEPDGLSGSGS